jgi:hypothetical protein
VTVKFWLIIVDVIDERSPDLIRRHRRLDHLHSRFKTEEEANELKARLETFGGRHGVVDLATTGGRCPRCGEVLIPWVREDEGGRAKRST